MNQSANAELATLGGNRHQIRSLNDALRRTGRSGRIVMTAGVASLGEELIAQVLLAVATFDAFDPDNDPHGEHDFGAVQVQGHRVFFKIDAYDRDLRYHSPDPADPAVTCRVMTLMLAEEY